MIIKGRCESRSRSTTFIIGSLILLSSLPLARSAMAQATAAGIVGTITDATGAVMPGVTVTVTGPALQVPQVLAVTDGQGQYRITPLPVGAYTVTYELTGFQTVKREGVQLGTGFVAKLDQSLKPGTVQETVTVTGETPTVDVTNPAHAVDLANETLETIPTTRDGLKAYVAQVPGLRANLEVGSSGMTNTVSIRAYGQSTDAWLLLDGVMFGGAANGVQGAQIDFNSIDSTRVETVGAQERRQSVSWRSRLVRVIGSSPGRQSDAGSASGGCEEFSGASRTVG
jgi:hypothetical protein